jgi:hypothetical protein
MGGYAFKDPALLATGAATGIAVMAAHGMKTSTSTD